MTITQESVGVPVVDISAFRTGDEADKQRVAEVVDQACSSLGFLIVSGHGVPLDLINRMHDVTQRFFDLPFQRKVLAKSSKSKGGAPGYRPVASSAAARSLTRPDAPPDLKEAFAVFPLYADDSDYYRREEALNLFQPNIWPDEPTDFRPTCEEYYAAMTDFGNLLLRIFARALRVPENYFDSLVDKAVSNINLINYPVQEHAPDQGQFGIGEHTDFGTFTMLHKDEGSAGLQVLGSGGEWIDVQQIPGTYIVNIGDLLSRWTNDHWVSTLHRVISPIRATVKEGSRHLSVVFFHNTNYDALIRPIPTCVSPERPAKYEPILSGEHRRIKRQKTHY